VVTVDFEPRIMAFVCNWCTYTGADLAGTSRLRMASNVRIIRLPCTGRIDHMFIVKAFERGADGVIVSGCHPADCHYTAGNYHARRRFTVFRELMSFMGIDPGRVTFSWVSASEGAKWKDVVDDTVARVRGLGPFAAYHELTPDEVAPDALWSEGVETGAANTTPGTDDDAAADGLALGPPNGANLPAAASSSADRGDPAAGGEL
jgi:coenzyme F420-reducing hydrogenase delta subunit